MRHMSLRIFVPSRLVSLDSLPAGKSSSMLGVTGAILAGQVPGDSATVSCRLERLLPGSMQQLFAHQEAAPVAIMRGTEWCSLELTRLEAVLGDLPLAGIVPSCARAVRSRQLAHLAGRLCAEVALQQLTGGFHAVGRQGDGAPIWPSGVLGSITHDAYGAQAVVAYRHDCRWLGIDIEPLLGAAGYLSVREFCLTAQEGRQLDRADRPNEEATLRFSAKEAYYKAVHPVLGGEMSFLDVELREPNPANQQFEIVPTIHPIIRANLPPLKGSYSILGQRVLTCIAA
jgi:enterobactin synthetase component D